MTDDEYLALSAKLPRLRKNRVMSEFGEIPESVALMRSLVAEAKTPDELAELYPLLLGECAGSGNDKIYLYCLRRSAEEQSGHPVPLAALAYGLATIDPKCRQEALEVAKGAVVLAKKQDQFVRHAANTLARVAIMLDDYKALEYAISVLISDSDHKRAMDSGYEFDIIERIDAQRIDSALLAKFKVLARARAGNTGMV